MRRLTPAVALFVFIALAGIAQAQTCPPPTVTLLGGTNPTCPGQPVTLDAGSGWTTYEWSPGGGTTRMISDAPTVTTSYTVTTTDANGCNVTSQPYTVVVGLDVSIAAPASICLQGNGQASVDPPAGGGTWATVNWQIANGSFTIDTYPYQSQSASGANVRFAPDGSGNPLTLTVTANDAQGCPAGGSKVVGLRTIAPPVITAPSVICPNGTGTASVALPAEGGNWQYVNWQITNGTFQSSDYPYYSFYANGSQVTFQGNGSGQPITLQVYATDGQYCQSQSSVTVNTRTIAPPVITAPAAICPNGMGTASVAPPAEGGSWQYVNWQITNGTFQSSDYPYYSFYAYGSQVTFHGDGSGRPITLQVYATDGQYCQNQSSVTVDARTIAPPVITAPAVICPNGTGTASVAPPAEGGSWQYVNWQITNGTFQSSDYPYYSFYAYGSQVTFHGDGSGRPITLQVYATDGQYCQNQSSVTVNARTIAPPVITAPAAICPNGMGTASVAPPAEGGNWQYINWQITNGTFQSSDYPYYSFYAYGPQVTFHGDGSGQPITLLAYATDGQYCQTQSSVTVNARTIAAPIISAPSNISAGATVNASVAPPAEGGSWQYVNWQITNGNFVSDTYPYQSAWANGVIVRFSADGSGQPVTLSVYVQDVQFCNSQSTVTVPLSTLVAPSISLATADMCPFGSDTATVPATYASYSWTVTNGVVDQGAGTNSIQFHPDAGGSGPLTVAVTVQNASGDSATASVMVAIRTLAAPQVTPAVSQICAGGSGSASAPSGYVAYQWSITHGAITGGAQTSDVTFQADGTGDVVLSLYVTDSGSCQSGTTSVTIPLVLATATVTPSGNVTMCGANRVLTANSGSSYLWSTGATTQSIVVTSGGTYSVTVTNGTGCAATSAPVTVTPSTDSMPIITASGPTTFCTGGSVTLTASPGIAYFWSSGDRTQAITPRFSGSYTVQVENADGCWLMSQPTVVSVGTMPFASIQVSGPTTFCNGSNVVLTAGYNPNATYHWSTGETTQWIYASTSGNYSVTVTSDSGCSATSVPVTVNVIGSKPVITGSPLLCGQQTTTLTASPGDSYSWSNGATTQSIQAGAGTYSVLVTTNGCPNQSDPVTVTWQSSPPSVTIQGRPFYCSSESAAASIDPGQFVSFKWTATNASISGADNQSSVNFVAGGAGSGSLQVVATMANGCQSSATMPFTIGLPDATITASTLNACSNVANTASVPDAGPGATYQWTATNANVFNGTGTHAVTFIPLADGPITFNVTVTLPGGCSSSGSKTISGEVLGSVTLTAPSMACAIGVDYQATLAGAPADATYQWTATSGLAITSSPSQPSITFHAVNGAYGGTLTLRITRGTCTWTRTADVALEQMTASISAPSTTVCPGATVHLTAYPSVYFGSLTYLWSNGATTASVDVGPGTYTVAINDGHCPVTSPAVTVTADATAAPVISAPAAYCSTTSFVAFTVPNASAFTTLSWSTSGFALQGAQYTVAPDPSKPLWIEVQGVTPAGCTLTTRVNVPLTSTPDATITAPDSLCSYNDYVASVPDAGPGAVYDWHMLGAEITSGVGTRQIHFTPYLINPSNPSVSLWIEVTTAAGCTVQNIHDMPISDSPNAWISFSAPGPFCGSQTLTATTPDAGPGVTYRWTITNGDILSGANTNTVTFSPRYGGGTSVGLDVYVTGTNGCTRHVSSGSPVLEPEASMITAGGPTSFCQGGSVTLTASGAADTVSYHWSNGATTRSITVTTSGNYSVTVTNPSGCTSTSTQTVNVTPTPAPVITPSGPTSFCTGGSVTLTASAGFSSYLWSNGATTQSITVNASGTYNVSATDAHGCSGQSATTPVTVNANPTATITAGGPTAFCAGGSVTLTASAGSSYLWSNGATTQSIAVSASGSYTVTVTNASGCSATSAATAVTVNSNPTATITAGGPTTFCAGGSVTLTASAGSSYLWSNGATTQAIAASVAGNYSVTVTNAAGCSATSAATAVTVNANPTATITAGGPTMFCAGGSVTLTASAGSSYLWSNGSTTQAITVNAGGNYSVIVTNANGCSGTSSPTTVTVNANPAATITAGGPTTFCAGGSVTLTASTGSSYLWSNGATTQAITVNASGNYIVTVTNAAGCSATSAATAVTVNSNPTATITAGGPTTFCAGGSVTLTASAGSSYLWSNGATTQAITVNGSGTYSVTVTDANGCSGTSSSTTVTVNTNPAATITAGGPTTFCAGGSVTLTASAGSSYLWSNGATTQAVTVNASGTYSVTVTDASGCSGASSPTTVTVNANPTATITAGSPTTFCAGGSVTLTASAGSSYLWSNGATTQATTASTSGNYSVTVTNAAGCSATSAATAVTVNANPTATITAGGPTTFCAGGSVTLTASAGSSYLWSNGATTQAITVNASGSFSVTVTGAAGCSATSAATAVTVNANPTATITAGGPTTFCAGGSVTLTASGGSSYLWSNGATTQAITASTSGNYSVTVTNAAGCSATSAATTVTVNANPAATITAGGPTRFCTGGSVTLTASAGSSYLWSNGATTQAITVNASGNYTVTVTNAAGCSSTSAATAVTVNANPATPVITANGPTTFCAGGSVTLTAPSASSYYWSPNGQSTQSITVNGGNTITVTVTDANGCSATSSPVTITARPNPSTSISSDKTNLCPGGSAVLTGGGTGLVSYLWSTGATTSTITVTSPGSYYFVGTDANGCSSTSATEVISAVSGPPIPVVTAGGPTTFCAGGSVQLTAPAGYTGYDAYYWSNGSWGQTITVSASGSYSVTVKDANGCTSTSAPTVVTVNSNPTATITAGGPTTFCAGGSVTLTASAGSSYLWSSGATTQAMTVNASGNYSVTVTNAAGCSATSAATAVTVNANPATPTITAGGPTTFCAGGSVTLTASAGSSYLWSNGATTQAITVNASGNYGVTVTNAAGCSATSAATAVAVNANPVATITAGGPTTFCAGGSVTLTASAGSSYLWSNGATTQAITVSASGSYLVTVTNAAGCSANSAPTAVTVNANPPTPTITAGGPTTFCAPGSVTLTASSGSSYLWSTGATSQAITVSASGSYTVAVGNASGCSATSAPTVVTVKANPQATITPGGATTFCTGGSVTLTASSGASYHWSTNATTQAITVSAAGNYSVTVTNASGCTSTSAVTAVTVNANPTTPVITPGGPTTFCAGGSVTLTAPAGFTYLWSTGATTQAITATASGSYTVTVTNANGCSATSAATNVTANPAPSITAFGPTSQTVLKNATPTTLTVTAGGTGTKTYQWYKGTSGTTTNPIGGATTTSYTPPTNTRGTFTYWVRVTIGSCTANSSTATVTVN